MKHASRLLAAVIVLIAAVAPAPRAADPVKPRIRAITGFVTIDAKNYAAQLEETVTFLNKVRDAVKASEIACTPTCTARPVCFCFLTTSWASGMECVIGFSQ